ncbi:MAG: DUF5615 family PIN-like protein [Cyclobacteriaceae bacterium]|nr:DUF5615 family PIN-like protein [Cyclobacteriaceae bacterium]
MRLLFDQNISFRVIKKLNNLFPECKHVSDCGLMDCEDSDIWEYARKNDYSIVTFDSDFYDISVINGHPPKIIWVRTGNLRTKDIVKLLMDNKDAIEKFLKNDDFKDISCLEID